MNRLVFTFGTLFDDEIVMALLGKIPTNFYATLPGYAVYEGSFDQLPSKVRDYFSAKGYDQQTFSYLFVKPDQSSGSMVVGRTYAVSREQELIIDHWEHVPEWYRKQTVTIQPNDGTPREAFVYTLDYKGKKLTEFHRVVNDPVRVIEAAKVTRAMVMEKFPEVFSTE